MAFYSSEYRPIKVFSVDPDFPFEIGPEFDQDIFRNRNYYLLSISGEGDLSDSTRLIDRILRQAEIYKKPFSDVIIVSHGWHRRIWQAAGTYDRLLGRISKMLYLGKYTVPHERRFDPLFVCIHWESETGPNVWSTLESRPDREHFINLVRQHCRSNYTDFEAIVDKFYEAFVLASAIGRDNSINDTDLFQIGTELSTELYKLVPLYSVHGDNRDAMTLLWRCFYDARPEKTVVDQKPLLLRYLKARQNPSMDVAEEGTSKISNLVTLARTVPWILLVLFVAWLLGFHIKFPSWSLWLLPIFSIGNVSITLFRYQQRQLQEPHDPTLMNVLSLFVLQLLCSIPLLLYLVITFVVGFRKECRPASRRDHDRAFVGVRQSGVLIGLSNVATFPYTTWEKFLPNQSVQGTICSLLNSQLSFWKMQSRSAKVGKHVADFVTNLYIRLGAKLDGAQLHLVGHSFGASVMTNAAEALASNKVQSPICDTLTLLLGAVDCHWPFNTSPEALARKRISCIFSKHDSANGFYYPLANAGRAALGYVGSCHKGAAIHIVPPVLPYPLTFSDATGPNPILFNVDASLIISKGSIMAGGAHNDIFKDEVMNILWQTTIGATL